MHAPSARATAKQPRSFTIDRRSNKLYSTAVFFSDAFCCSAPPLPVGPRWRERHAGRSCWTTMVRKTFGRELLVYDGEKDMREGAAGPRWRERHAGNFTRLKPVGDGSNRPRTPIAIFGRAVP